MSGNLEQANQSISDGQCIVYPTETVYGIGANALNSESVERVYEAKNRDYSKPISMAVPNIQSLKQHVYLNEREEQFIQENLPGPVTVICEKKDHIPDILTSGSDRLGVRIPDYNKTLRLLRATGPITATSANISGTGSVVDTNDLSESFLDNISTVVDDGILDGGTGSTVVDVSNSEIHREGAVGDQVDAWLQNN